MAISKWLKWTLATFVSCALVAACSNSDDNGANTANGGPGGNAGNGGNGQPSGGPCTLASETEIEEIVPGDVVKSEEQVSAGDPYCTWYDSQGYSVMVLHFQAADLFDVSKGHPESKPLAGIGDDAHLGMLGTVNVAVSGRAFFAQSLVPAKDSELSPEVRAVTGIEGEKIAIYEASFRFAKLVIGRF